MVKAWRVAASIIRPKIRQINKKNLFLLRPAASVSGHGLVFGHGVVLVKGLVASYKPVESRRKRWSTLL